MKRVWRRTSSASGVSSAEAAKPLEQAQGRSLSLPGLPRWFRGFCTTPPLPP